MKEAGKTCNPLGIRRLHDQRPATKSADLLKSEVPGEDLLVNYAPAGAKSSDDELSFRYSFETLRDKMSLTAPTDRLVGLVVKASTSRAGGPGFESR